jgi:hypothetical protein
MDATTDTLPTIEQDAPVQDDAAIAGPAAVIAATQPQRPGLRLRRRA